MSLMDSLRTVLTGRAAIKECLGLYISPEGMCLAEGAVGKGGRIEVRQAVKIPMPPNLGTARVGTLNTELLEKTDKLAEVLKPVLAQGKWSSKHLVVTLSPHFGLTRYFVMPEVSRKFQRQSVPLEAKKYIPFPFGELMYDFQVVAMSPGGDKKPRMGVLFGITPQKNVVNLKALADKVGLDLASIELATLSVSRAWQTAIPPPEDDGSGAQAEVQFDPQATYVVIHKRGLPLLAREVYWAPGAEVDKRRIDLNGCIDFVKKQLGVAGVRIRVMGSAKLAEWQKTFQEDFNVPVEAADLSAALSSPDVQWATAAAVGASIRFLAYGGSSLDISQITQKINEDGRVVVDLWLASGAVSAFFLALGLFSQSQIVWTLSSLESLNKESGDIAAFKDKTAEQIQALMNSLQAQVSALTNILGPKASAADLMAMVADNIPEAVWVTDFDYSNALAVTVGEPGRNAKVELKGLAMAGGAAEEIQLLNLFRDNLKKDKRFGKYFTTIDLSLDRKTVSGDLMQTVFSLTCARRKVGA